MHWGTFLLMKNSEEKPALFSRLRSASLEIKILKH
jgi:hypothetical protein